MDLSSVVDASRRYDGNRYDRSDRNRDDNSAAWSRNNDNDKKRENVQQVSPQQNRQSQANTPVAPSQPAQPSQAVVTPPSQPAVQQVAPVVAATPPPVDTAPQAQLTASSQAATASASKVIYTTEKISAELRDRLLIMAAVVGLSGALLYTFSFITPLPPRPVLSTRRIIPVMEG